MSYCPRQLASSLSDHYRNTSSFDGAPSSNSSSSSASLNDYLSTHGLLLTMCFPSSCSLGFGAKSLSASWIRQDIGASRIIPTQTGVGLILDPSLVHIDCLYPTDAGTLSRDQKGCGPMAYDRNEGSQGAASYNKNPIKKFYAKKFFTDYKNLNFGRSTKWEDIDCQEFFNLPPVQQERLWGFNGDNETQSNTSVHYYSTAAVSNTNTEAIMGHPVCDVDLLPDDDDADDGRIRIQFPLYYDAKSWGPEDFQEVIDLEMQFMRNETTSGDMIWNEFVISLPDELPPLIQGLFYLNENLLGVKRAKRREIARKQAKTLGDLPVFVLHNEGDWDGDVLECDEEADEEDYSIIEGSVFGDFEESFGAAQEKVMIQAHLAKRQERPPQFEDLGVSSLRHY